MLKDEVHTGPDISRSQDATHQADFMFQLYESCDKKVRQCPPIMPVVWSEIHYKILCCPIIINAPANICYVS